MVARARAARWKISMMTIRPPQQGHGRRGSGSGAACSTAVEEDTASHFRARATLAFRQCGEEAVVTDAASVIIVFYFVPRCAKFYLISGS